MFKFRKIKELDKKIEKYRKEMINVKGYVIQIEEELKKIEKIIKDKEGK